MSPEAFHQVASLSSGGLDTLPYNRPVLTLLAITDLSYKERHLNYFHSLSPYSEQRMGTDFFKS